MKNLIMNTTLLLTLAFGFASCTEEISEEIQNEEKLAESGSSSSSSTDTLSMSVTNQVSSQYSHFLHEKDSEDEGCELKINNASDLEASDYSYENLDLNTDCILDAGEYDLYYQGAEFKIDIDPGLCENVVYTPLKFFQFQPGNSNKVLYKVKCDEICSASDNSDIKALCENAETLYDDFDNTVIYNPANGAATLPVLNSTTPDKTTDLCRFDYSNAGEFTYPNCDEGKISIKAITLTGTEEDPAATAGNGCSVQSTDGTSDRETQLDCELAGAWTPISCELVDVATLSTPEATCNATTTWTPGQCQKNDITISDTNISQAQCVSTTNQWVEGFCLVAGVKNGDLNATDCGTSGGSWNRFGSCSDTQYTYEDDCELPANGANTWTANKLPSDDPDIKGGYCSLLPSILTNEVDCEFTGVWSNASCSDPELTNEALCTVEREWKSGACFTTAEVTSTQCASYQMTTAPTYTTASCSIATRIDQASCEAAGEWTAPNTCGDSTGAAAVSFVLTPDDDEETECGGSNGACLAGPLADLSSPRSRGIITQIEEGESYSNTHEIPSPYDEGYLSNMYIANYSRVCSEIGSTKNSAYWLSAPNLETAQIERDNADNNYKSNARVEVNEYEILATSPFKGTYNFYEAAANASSYTQGRGTTSPYYSFRCLDHAGDVKAQIRIFIREWDRSFINENQAGFDFTAVSDIWLTSNSRYMDSYNASNAPTDEWNDVRDWDDFWKDQDSGNEIYTNNSCQVLEIKAKEDVTCSISARSKTSHNNCVTLGTWNGGSNVCEYPTATTESSCLAMDPDSTIFVWNSGTSKCEIIGTTRDTQPECEQLGYSKYTEASKVNFPNGSL